MKVQFWGTRGSIAKPGPGTLRYGGNTSCVEVRSSAETLVVIDCGTGLQNLGQALMNEGRQPLRGNVLISHTHWDHIQGIPFFSPFFMPNNEWDIYAPRGLSQSIQDALSGQMQYTYFPITLEGLGATIRYHDLLEGIFDIDDITIRTQYLNHPALTFAYRLEADGVSVVYASDHEPHSRDLASGSGKIGEQDQRHVDFLHNADLVIHDAQFSESEYAEKIGWGHSTINYAVNMCRIAGVKILAFTHHDPLRDDDGVEALLEAAHNCLNDQDSSLQIFAAAEGNEIDLKSEVDSKPFRNAESFSATTSIAPALREAVILLGVADPGTASLLIDAAQVDDVQVIAENDGNSILQAFKRTQPSLVVLGDQPKGDSGLHLCSAIRGLDDNHASDVPIIVLADQEDVDEGMGAGVSDWLIKPFSKEYARTRMRAWVLRSACRWQRANLPNDEAARLAALKRINILDTVNEERFDRVTRLAAAMFNVPIALVSLVDSDRQWFKSCYGLGVEETSREVSFCAHAILKSQVMVVPDTFLDSRFADNPLVVDEPRIRFYAGCPLILPDGCRLGTLCVIDVRPRQFDTKNIGLLEDLGKMVEQELTLIHS